MEMSLFRINCKTKTVETVYARTEPLTNGIDKILDATDGQTLGYTFESECNHWYATPMNNYPWNRYVQCESYDDAIMYIMHEALRAKQREQPR